ncbi:zinc transporter ZIP3-like [Metopolophium dirhodum]|uniref:zinc transporter ZIP3-like n=1 Tax=Metopolophium dirhodum TaxID=44670 RepID=UPI002990723F|nr:zinc transporter ZIP3-like [Metopolophium dirhodum]
MAETVIVSDDATATSTSALVDQIIVAKTFAMLVLGLGSFVLGVVPLKLTKWWRMNPAAAPPSHQTGGHSHGGDSATGSPAVSLLLCFGGGVLLFTTLLHLQPEVREGVGRLQKSGQLPNGQGTEHLGDLIFCAGFFMVFIVDEIVHSVLDRCAAGHVDRSSAEEVLHRSMSLRRRTMSIPRASLAGSGGSPSSVPSVTGGMSVASNKELLQNDVPCKPHDKRYRPAAWESGGTAPSSTRFAHHQQRVGDNDTEKQMKLESGGGPGGVDGGHSFRGLFAVLALSFHEVFEGLAIGLEERVDNMWYLFIAVATHKLVIAFCIGLELAWSKTRRPVLVMYVATFAVVTPVGIIIGMVLVQCGTGGTVDGSPGRVAVILQGLAAGTLLYVVFFEVLARHKQSGFLHLLSIMFGFSILLVLQMMTHQHSHGPVDNNQHSDHDHSSHEHEHEHEHVHDH